MFNTEAFRKELLSISAQIEREFDEEVRGYDVDMIGIRERFEIAEDP